MKKRNLIACALGTLLICAGAMTELAISLQASTYLKDLQVSTVDVFNEEKGIESISLKKAATSSSIDCSKIYAQAGNDGTNYYLRFATAVRGNLKDITYNASFADSDYQLESKNVTLVYKSIVADGQTFYHNGENLVDESLLTTKDYYWACYTIKYAPNSQYMDTPVDIEIDVNNGDYTSIRQVSLKSLISGGNSTPSEYTLGDYYKDYSSKGLQPQFTYTRVLDNYKHNGFEIAQGGTTDGSYLYYSINAAGNNSDTKNSAGYVVKFDVAAKKVIAATEQIGTVSNSENGLGNANLFYNPKDGMIYSFGLVRVCGNNYKASSFSSDYMINPNDMSVTKLDNALESEKFDFETPSMSTYFPGKSNVILRVDNMQYNATLDRYMVIYRAYEGSYATTLTPTEANRRMFIYDGEGKLVKDVTQNVNVHYSTDTGYTIQEATSDARYIYIDYTKYNQGYSRIKIFDWSGNYITEVVMGGTNVFSGSSANSNIQNVIYLNGDLYVASYYSNYGLCVTKVSYPRLSESSDTPSGPTPETCDQSKLSFGELMEYSSLKGTDFSLDTQLIKGKIEYIDNTSNKHYVYAGDGKATTVTFNKYYLSKGMATDGTYVYAILNAESGTNSGYDVGIIVKMDLNGNILSTSDYSYHFGNGPRLSYINGNLYVTRTLAVTNGSTYSDAKKYQDVTLQFDSNLKLINDDYKFEGFDLPEGVILNVAANNANTKYAFLVKQQINGAARHFLYTFVKNSNGNFEKVCDGIEYTSYSNAQGEKATLVAQLFANDNYIYLMFTMAKNPVIYAMDYEGNVFNTKRLDSQAEGTHTSKNYQAFLEIQGNLYLSTAQWDNSSAVGFYFYRVIKRVANSNSTFTVEFDTNGCSTSISSQLVQANGKIKKPTTPEYKYTDSYGKQYNFVLENWYNGEKVWNFDTDVVTSDMTLRANWTLEDSYFECDPNASTRTSGTTLRVMSFNVLADDWNNKPAVDDTRSNQGFNTIERYQPDVVGLQEFDDQWYNQAKKFFDGYTIVNKDNIKPFGPTNYSTLAYNTSTVKLVEYTQVALETCNSLNNCRYVTIGTFEFIKGENLGERFIVSSTHWDLEETCRVKQASQHVDIVNEWLAKYPNLPVIMTGDFNTREDTDSYNKIMEKGGYVDTKLDAQTKGIICNTIHLGTPMRVGDKVYTNPNHVFRGPASFSSLNILNETSIDHIFATTDVTSLYHSVIIDEDALGASDHCPIYSDLKF